MALLTAVHDVALVSLLLVTGRSQAPASCTFRILSLDAIAAQAPIIVVEDVSADRPDPAGGYTAAIRVRGVLKGAVAGSTVELSDLGATADVCTVGPVLPVGNRYLL